MGKYVKVRVRGVDQYVRNLAQTKIEGKKAARIGVIKAANYLMEKIKAKFGVYQPGWPKLKYDTSRRKARKGLKKGPLLATGEMRDSFSVIEGGPGRISASVGSDDERLIHHIYGAPRAGVPQRDPVISTANEERKETSDIIEREILKMHERMSKL